MRWWPPRCVRRDAVAGRRARPAAHRPAGPAPGRRAAAGGAGAAARRDPDGVRAPGLNPDSPADLLRVPAARGPGGDRHPVVDAGSELDAPRDRPAAGLQEAAAADARPTAGRGWTPGCATAGSARCFVPGGVVTGRWASHGGGRCQLPGAAAGGRGGRRGVAARGRRRRPAGAPGAGRDEPATRRWPRPPGAATCTRAWSTAAPWRPGSRPSSASSARCTAAPAARAAR